ncbi:hypothetical protein BN2476_600045 [Paraburkholderia piptadeniae]|uniref:Uncharacterized protein n=1 Tax=Paraburkholderia piptadeniae TaxID=1701573 RepID=A0A1N7SKD1_9BURK|nr:hypothetical protein BN2476_600045 [Paraburkholderia piptadeniae]
MSQRPSIVCRNRQRHAEGCGWFSLQRALNQHPEARIKHRTRRPLVQDFGVAQLKDRIVMRFSVYRLERSFIFNRAGRFAGHVVS